MTWFDLNLPVISPILRIRNGLMLQVETITPLPSSQVL
jgi:hypothetical protein